MSTRKMTDLVIKISLVSFVIVFGCLVTGLKMVAGLFMILFLVSALISIYMTVAY